MTVAAGVAVAEVVNVRSCQDRACEYVEPTTFCRLDVSCLEMAPLYSDNFHVSCLAVSPDRTELSVSAAGVLLSSHCTVSVKVSQIPAGWYQNVLPKSHRLALSLPAGGGAGSGGPGDL